MPIQRESSTSWSTAARLSSGWSRKSSATSSLGERRDSYTVIATIQHGDAQEERDRLQRRRGRDLHRVAERQRSPRRGRLRALHAGVDGSRHADAPRSRPTWAACSSVSARVCASNIAEVPMAGPSTGSGSSRAESRDARNRGVDRGAPGSRFTLAVGRHRCSHQRRYAPYRRASFNLDSPGARDRGGRRRGDRQAASRRILAASRSRSSYGCRSYPVTFRRRS